MNEESQARLSEETLAMLRKSGWVAGRNLRDTLELPPGFSPFPEALRVLSEFGKLQVGSKGPGIHFGKSPLVLNPMLADGEEDRFAEFEEVLGSRLYPLGETGDGHLFVAIDIVGRVFLLGDQLFFVADNFEHALEVLLRGLKQPPRVDENGHWE